MAATKTSRKRSTASSEPSLQEQAEQLQRKLGESAQQIWLAGMGAFGRAQSGGSRLFETLVKEGRRASEVREAVDSRAHDARARATETFDRIDQAVRGKVQGALKSLEVPTRRELGTLLDRIDALNDYLRRYNGQADTPAARARKAAARKTATRTSVATGGPVATQAAAKKVASRTVPRKGPSKTASEVAAKKTAARKVVR
jgi:poly(hydroxyalkanoate) granule-associated protein